MTDNGIPKLLEDTLESYFHVDSAYEWDRVKRFLEHPNFPERASQFKKELANAIVQQNISPAFMQDLTAISFDEKDEVTEYLQEIWSGLYDDEPVTV